MYINKIGLCLIFCVFCFGNEEVYEFCAFFAENPNEYSLHPVSNNDLIIKSFDAYRTQGMEPNVHFRFDAPSDTLDSLIGACAVLNGLPIDDFNFHLNGASKNLEAHYGKILNGEVESYDFSSMGKKSNHLNSKSRVNAKNSLLLQNIVLINKKSDCTRRKTWTISLNFCFRKLNIVGVAVKNMMNKSQPTSEILKTSL